VPFGSNDGLCLAFGKTERAWGKPVDGEIRIAVGKCLRVFAYFELLFGVPATAMVALTGLEPPIGLGTMLAFGVGQVLLGVVIGRSGLQARRLARSAELNPAMERAVHLG
jgi:hypothetical protein